jgi:hypothetical protein
MAIGKKGGSRAADAKSPKTGKPSNQAQTGGRDVKAAANLTREIG